MMINERKVDDSLIQQIVDSYDFKAPDIHINQAQARTPSWLDKPKEPYSKTEEFANITLGFIILLSLLAIILIIYKKRNKNHI